MLSKYLFKLFATTLVFATLSGCVSSPKVPATDVPPLSVQLHSVKHAVKADFKGTLTALSEMGFAGVEFAGNYGPYANDPEGLKAFLASLNLKASGAHLGTKQLRGELGEKNLTFLKSIGVELVIIPHDARVDQPDELASMVEEFRALTKIVESYGLMLGYHNHAKEFAGYSESTFWDYLAQNTPDNFVLQLDVGWANYADADPIDYVKRYPNRTLTTHYKIRTKKDEGPKPVIIGLDDFNWTKMIKTNISVGGTQWIVIEQEEYPQALTPLETVAASMQGLQRIIDEMTQP
jgi:sugar phosphate isomerase/epimerase